jgi:hypothetical protein
MSLREWPLFQENGYCAACRSNGLRAALNSAVRYGIDQAHAAGDQR